MTDGTTNTAAMSETLIGDHAGDHSAATLHTIDLRRVVGVGSKTAKRNASGPGFQGIIDPDVPDLLKTKTEAWGGDRASAWIVSKPFTSTFNTYSPPNPPYADWYGQGIGFFAARSFHPGGANVAFADGRIQFVPNTIDTPTWRSMGTIADGEVATGF